MNRGSLVVVLLAGAVACRPRPSLATDDEEDARLPERAAAPLDAAPAVDASASPPAPSPEARRAAYLALPPTAAPLGSARGFFTMRCPDAYEAVEDDGGLYCGKLCGPYYGPCPDADGGIAGCCGTHRCDHHVHPRNPFAGAPDGPMPDACSPRAAADAKRKPKRR